MKLLLLMRITSIMNDEDVDNCEGESELSKESVWQFLIWGMP